MERKTIGVTGAMGYIGGAICIELKNRGYKVLGLDVNKLDYLKPFIDYFYQADYEDISRLTNDWGKCHAIIHCAGTSLVGPSVDKPHYYYRNNVAKTIKLLEWCVDHNKHFLFSSSASVYKSKTQPLIESDEKDPQSPYAKSKWMIEQVVDDYTRALNLKATIFRYFNACGSYGKVHGQAPGATHIFARLFEDKSSFVLNGDDYSTPDGTCIRDYIHIRDIAVAHVKAIEKNVYGVYNLGSNHGYSNKQIMDTVGVNVWGLGPKRPGDTPCLIANNKLAKQALEWSPQYSLKDIVNELKEWYDSETYSGLQHHPA